MKLIFPFLLLTTLTLGRLIAQDLTRQELCDYINDKIAARVDSAYLEKISELETTYPEATKQADWCGSLCQEVDRLVDLIYGADASNPYHDENCENIVRDWGLAFSNDVDASLPVGIAKHVILVDQSEKDQQEKWQNYSPGEVTGPQIISGGTLIVGPSK